MVYSFFIAVLKVFLFTLIIWPLICLYRYFVTNDCCQITPFEIFDLFQVIFVLSLILLGWVFFLDEKAKNKK